MFVTPPAGNSGMGSYHGKFSFDHLSHLRGCLIKQLKMEGVNQMRYPPHTPKKLGWARFFILRHVELGKVGCLALLAVLSVVIAVMLQVKQHLLRVYIFVIFVLLRNDSVSQDMPIS